MNAVPQPSTPPTKAPISWDISKYEVTPADNVSNDVVLDLIPFVEAMGLESKDNPIINDPKIREIKTMLKERFEGDDIKLVDELLKIKSKLGTSDKPAYQRIWTYLTMTRKAQAMQRLAEAQL